MDPISLLLALAALFGTNLASESLQGGKFKQNVKRAGISTARDAPFLFAGGGPTSFKGALGKGVGTGLGLPQGGGQQGNNQMGLANTLLLLSMFLPQQEQQQTQPNLNFSLPQFPETQFAPALNLPQPQAILPQFLAMQGGL